MSREKFITVKLAEWSRCFSIRKLRLEIFLWWRIRALLLLKNKKKTTGHHSRIE